MRVWHIALLCTLSAICFFIAGCFTNKSAAPTKSAHEHMHVHGPHDGELIEIGDEEYHAEMVHDNQTVTIYVLDKKHAHTVPISAEAITIRMVANDKPIEFKLAAKPQERDPSGKSSRFESQDQALDLALDDEKAERELILPIGDKTFAPNSSISMMSITTTTKPPVQGAARMRHDCHCAIGPHVLFYCAGRPVCIAFAQATLFGDGLFGRYSGGRRLARFTAGCV